MTIADCEKQMDEIKEKSVQLCEKKKVLEAINILKELNKKFYKDETKKQPLLEEAADSPVFLQVTLKKIPSRKMGKRIKVSLPHSMVTDTTDVCLITGDLDKRNKKAEVDPDVLHYKELLKKQGITKVTEVITLRQLRTEYKVYESKRQLMAAYDVFLSDKKISQCLPRILGKVFFKKRKFPIQINMETSNLKNQIDKALSETVFSVTGRGNSCTSEIARLSMENSEILANVLASVQVLADQLPGQQKNIFGIYIKTAKSQAIPLFLSFGNPNEVELPKPVNHENVELEELSTLPNAQVKVFSDGRIVVKKLELDMVDEGSSEIEAHHAEKKRMDGKGVEGKTEGVESESGSSGIKDTEDTSPSKTKLKKRKSKTFDVKNEETDSSKVAEIHPKEAETESIVDTNVSKSRLKSRRKANNDSKVQVNETKNAKKRKSVNAIEKDKEDTSKAPKRKKTADVESVLKKAQSKVQNTRKNVGLKKSQTKIKS